MKVARTPAVDNHNITKPIRGIMSLIIYFFYYYNLTVRYAYVKFFIESLWEGRLVNTS